MRDRVAASADDLDKVRASVIEGAGMYRNLWLGFITFGAYLLITVGSVTHRHLFLENPIKLPLLNVELPLVGFFVIAPILFMIFHAYFLLHLKLMADDVRRFGALLERVGLDRDTENHIRQQLPKFVLVRLLGGPRNGWRSGTDWLLLVIAWITIIVGPLILLLMIQLQFLPYHHQWGNEDVVYFNSATWVHRVILILDLALLWCFWPAITRGIEFGAITGGVLAGVAVGFSLYLVGFSVFVATFPGENIHNNRISARMKVAVPEGYFRGDGYRNEATLTEYLFQGQVDDVRGVTTSWFSNSLVLSDQDFVDDEQFQKIISRDPVGTEPWAGERTLSLRGRNLDGAVLVRADLRRADFAGASLAGADLERAHLDGAYFGCAVIGTRASGCAKLPFASLAKAFLRGASLNGARLQGASLEKAHLQGASLAEAHMQGASLRGAELQGASLAKAHLEGGSAVGAHFQGASLRDSYLSGASLRFADLQAASLFSAHLEGVLLDWADLKAAKLDWAHLQGASLYRTELGGSSFDKSHVWRSDATHAVGAPLVKEPILEPMNEAEKKINEWLKNVPTGANKQSARERLNVLTLPPVEADVPPNFWSLSAEELTSAVMEQREAERNQMEWAEIKSYACFGANAEAAAVRGMVTAPRANDAPIISSPRMPMARRLAEEIINCPVARYIDAWTMAELELLAGEPMAEGLEARPQHHGD